MNTQRDYYAYMYNQKTLNEGFHDNFDKFVGDCKIPNLIERDRNICEGIILVDEASNALRNMKNGSFPGTDGLTTEFYKVFWLKLKSVVTASFNYSFTRGHLSYTQSSAVITLLYKGKSLS